MDLVYPCLVFFLLSNADISFFVSIYASQLNESYHHPPACSVGVVGYDVHTYISLLSWTDVQFIYI